MNDPFHKGNLHSKFGTFIGLPIAFVYNSPAEVPMDNYRIGQTITIEDGTQEGAVLKKSIILGKNAVKYALLRECLLTDSYDAKKYNVVCPNYIYDVTVVIKMNMSRSNLFLHQPIETPSMLLRSLLIYSFPCSI